MKSIQFKDAFVSHKPDQEEIIILGGKSEMNDQDLKTAANHFKVNNFKTVKTEVFSAGKNHNGAPEYLHYALVYGSKSPHWEKAVA